MSHLYMAPNAWDEPTVWHDDGTANPKRVLARHNLPEGAGGDLLWSVLEEQLPEGQRT